LKKSTSSTSRIVYNALDVKGWLARPPSAAEARPGRCPGCEAASQPVGGALGLHGHGVRDRQLRGPLAADGEPTTAVVWCRRYRCTRCGAIVLVMPRGVAPRRQYSQAAISMALALWGLMAMPAEAVRERVCAWRARGQASAGWSTLRRWAQAARTAPGPSLRGVAGRAAQIAVGRAPPGDRGAPLWAQAFAGGATMP
jgi:hypothetical protein